MLRKITLQSPIYVNIFNSIFFPCCPCCSVTEMLFQIFFETIEILESSGPVNNAVLHMDQNCFIGRAWEDFEDVLCYYIFLRNLRFLYRI